MIQSNREMLSRGWRSDDIELERQAIAQHAQALRAPPVSALSPPRENRSSACFASSGCGFGVSGGAKLEAARLTAIESLASKGGEIAPDALHDIRFFATTTPAQAATIRAADWLRQARPPENKKSYRACCVTAPDRLDQRIAENRPGSVRC